MLPAVVIVICGLAACAAPDASPGLRQAPPFPGSAGATDWTEGSETPTGYGPDGVGFESPQALVDAIVAEFQPQVADRRLVLTGYLLGEDGQGGAIAVLYALGGVEDSTAGDEVQLSMRPADDGRWRIVAYRSRTHCRRAVEDGACV
jgi:hypothetical protein